MKKITVAIDGFSSSGKSTMARELARRVGYTYVDSGAMYRAVTLYAMRNGMTNSDGTVDTTALVAALPAIKVSFAKSGIDGVQHTLLNGEDVESQIRSMEVSGLVSPVSAIPEVREYLVRLQQDFGRDGGIVMDGRDIGTTVFPNAELKIFVNASPEERARRRALELEQKTGKTVNFGDILNNVRERDRIDSTRAVSPLRKADDAHELNNDRMTREQQMEWLVNLFDKTVNA